LGEVTEIKTRISALQKKLSKTELAGVIIADYIDMFYYSGTAQQGLLFVGRDNSPILVIKSNADRAREETPWTVYDWEGTAALSRFLEMTGIKEGKVGMELDVLPVKEYQRYVRVLQCEIVDASLIIKKQRMKKSEYELEKIRQSAEKHNNVLAAIPKIFKRGMKEVELAAEVEALSRKQGHQGFIPFRGFNQYMFFGHVTSGYRAAMPSSIDSPTGGKGITPVFPQSATLDKIEANTPLLVDYVGRYESYLADQTRIYCMGSLPKELMQAHEAALEIQEVVASAAKPGAVTGDLYQMALDMASKSGFEKNFMGYGRQVSFIGHGIGLELNELPIIAKGTDTVLELNMVFALEPKFVFPGQGVVGIENTFMITPQGTEKLGKYTDEIVYL